MAAADWTGTGFAARGLLLRREIHQHRWPPPMAQTFQSVAEHHLRAAGQLCKELAPQRHLFLSGVGL